MFPSMLLNLLKKRFREVEDVHKEEVLRAALRFADLLAALRMVLVMDFVLCLRR